MNRVFLVSLGLLFLFAWMDVQKLIMLKTLDSKYSIGQDLWNLWWAVGSPAQVVLFLGVLAAIGGIWYLLFKDKSEAIALFASPAIMILMGTQDLIYFLISPIDSVFENVGCWADVMMPIRIISDLLGESCPTATSFIISGVLGIFLGLLTYKLLQKWER